MSLNRTAARARPLLLQRSIRNSRTGIPPNFHIPAVAILLPQIARGLSTDPSTSQSGANGSNQPPPGFNIDAAKRAPSKQQQQQQQEQRRKQGQSSSNTAAEMQKGVEIPTNKPTEVPKSEAAKVASLTELAAGKARAQGKEEKSIIEKKKEEQKKLTAWQKVKKEAAHYWDGTKLLAAEVKISWKLAVKMAAGYELTRRENRQLQRTVKDLGRLVPFSVFIIVPFAEFLLPVALKIFPNLLPSTYEGTTTREAKAAHLRSTRKEVSNLLRQTLQETGLPVSAANAQREEFTEFFRKIRSTGESPTQADVIKVCKIFKDDLTLDNVSRPQLVGICRYMNLNSIGPDTLLRYQIRHRMRQIKRDDRAISFEGVDSLSIPELQTACASRGLRTHGVSPGRLRDDLQMWLDLRLKYGVPSTLLVLSNAFMYSQGKEVEGEFGSQIDALQAVLSSIPEELFHEIELEVHTAEGAATNKQRLEVLKEQQELIEEENEQRQGTEAAGKQTPKDDVDIDVDEKEEAQGKKKKEE